MDSPTKTGKVYLQSHRTDKKWKPVCLSLFPPSDSATGPWDPGLRGAGAEGDHMSAVRRHYQPHVDRKVKVLRLSELISVLRLPPNAEACPMENMSAFCVETQDRTMVFAALKDDCVEWVEKLCLHTFQRGVAPGSTQLHMEENQIYASADEASEFWVMVQKTEAATRCGLQGSYWLEVGREALLLRETQKNIVREWPYKLLRRYGNDKLALTIEAGRRCDSGPGTFTFETQQAEKIFALIQSTIKQKTLTVGNQNQEGQKVMVTNIRAHSPLPRVPDVTSIAVNLENKLRTQDSKCAAVEESARAQEDLVGPSESALVQPVPITLMPLPLVPTHGSRSGGHLDGQSEAIYADPADYIQPVPKAQPSVALYVDAASVLPLKPPSSRESVTPSPNLSISHPCFPSDTPDSVYAEVYDKISPAQNIQVANDEPIYTEPMSKGEKCDKKEGKADPFAHLYAHVWKTTPSSNNAIPSCASMSTADATAKSVDDVIYENLGSI
ncbi:docking protein 1 [Etheostoma spectabile]|nr:docking protein 1-like [Etheostoma spectabile]